MILCFWFDFCFLFTTDFWWWMWFRWLASSLFVISLMIGCPCGNNALSIAAAIGLVQTYSHSQSLPMAVRMVVMDQNQHHMIQNGCWCPDCGCWTSIWQVFQQKDRYSQFIPDVFSKYSRRYSENFGWVQKKFNRSSGRTSLTSYRNKYYLYYQFVNWFVF